MQHTESYRLVVTDHVEGRKGMAYDYTGWEEDPEGAIIRYRKEIRNQVDGTTVNLFRVETTSLMSSIRAVRAPRRPSVPPERVQEEPADVTEVRLTPALARVLLLGRHHGYQVPVSSRVTIPLGAVGALIDRGLLHTVETAQDPHRLTDRGAVLADILDAENQLAPSWFLDGRGERTYTV